MARKGPHKQQLRSAPKGAFTEKALAWVGGAKKEYLEFPDDVQDDAGYQIDRLQRGLELTPGSIHSLSKIGDGVCEIRISKGEEYRVVYIAKFAEAIYVLHAFHKKSTIGIAIPKANKATIEARYAALTKHRSEQGLSGRK